MPLPLIDGEETSRQNPNTFLIPSDTRKQFIKTGDFVKLGFLPLKEGERTERMWVKVHSIIGDEIFGVLNNDPLTLTHIKDGDTVKCNLKHVLDIIPSDEPPTLQ